MKNDVDEIRIAGVVRESIVDGPGIRFVVFGQGCIHKCIGCHNPETHDETGGYLCKLEKITSAIDSNPILSGVTFSGGDPFCQPEAFYNLALKLKEGNLHILAFTGYTYEQLLELSEKNEFVCLLLNQLDEIIDGKFILAQRDLTLRFKGSRNQRHIDLNKTRETGEVVEIA